MQHCIAYVLRSNREIFSDIFSKLQEIIDNNYNDVHALFIKEFFVFRISTHILNFSFAIYS